MKRKTHLPPKSSTVRYRNYYRHQERRAKAKMETIVREAWGYNRMRDYPIDEEDVQLLIQGRYQNRHKCSCNMCTTPRNSSWYKGKAKLTKQERIDRIRVEEEIQEEMGP